MHDLVLSRTDVIKWTNFIVISHRSHTVSEKQNQRELCTAACDINDIDEELGFWNQTWFQISTTY